MWRPRHENVLNAYFLRYCYRVRVKMRTFASIAIESRVKMHTFCIIAIESRVKMHTFAPIAIESHVKMHTFCAIAIESRLQMDIFSPSAIESRVFSMLLASFFVLLLHACGFHAYRYCGSSMLVCGLCIFVALSKDRRHGSERQQKSYIRAGPCVPT